MKASSYYLLGQGNENIVSKFRGQPTFKVYYGIMRKFAIIVSIQKRRLKMNHFDMFDLIGNEDSECEKNFSDSSIAITEIKATESTVQNLYEDITKIAQLKENIQQIKSFSNELEPRTPEQKPRLYRALHCYEYQVPPRMAIVLPTPLQGSAVWVDPNDYISRMRQYSGSLPRSMKLPPNGAWSLDHNDRNNIRQNKLYAVSYIGQKLYDIIESLQSAAESIASTYRRPASSIKPKRKVYHVILSFLLLILTIAFFYLIWISTLPEEILVMFSGMYTLLISFLYTLLK